MIILGDHRLYQLQFGQRSPDLLLVAGSGNFTIAG
jgi:hypothetical protein